MLWAEASPLSVIIQTCMVGFGIFMDDSIKSRIP